MAAVNPVELQNRLWAITTEIRDQLTKLQEQK
jgi:hypothetical protein